MVTNITKSPQSFDGAFTAVNKGILDLPIASTVQRIVLSKILKAKPTAGIVHAEFIGKDFLFPRVQTAGAGGSLTPSVEDIAVISTGARVVTLASSALTKTSGLELDFGTASGTPRVGDRVYITAENGVAKDSGIIGVDLTVISVSGTKAKFMLEVPSAAALPSTGNLIVTIKHVSESVNTHGFYVTSVSRTGSTVTLKGSVSRLLGAVEAQAKLVVGRSSSLLADSKVRSGNSKNFVIISSGVGFIVVSDPEQLLKEKALGSDFIDNARIAAVGDFSLVGANVIGGLSKGTIIDLTKLTGSAEGDAWKIFAFYGGAN